MSGVKLTTLYNFYVIYLIYSSIFQVLLILHLFVRGWLLWEMLKRLHINIGCNSYCQFYILITGYAEIN